MTTSSHQDGRMSFLSFGTILIILITLAGAGAAVWRLIGGLGPTTHLSDDFPWGIWKQLNVLVGIALSAGGFTIAATVYILNLKEYKPIARTAVLAAFAGYLNASISLLFDIGKPLVFWHPIVMWQPHSVLFEVIWCLLLYTIVLVLELSPALFEGLRQEKLARLLHRLMIPFVMLAVTLSFLHQSSLGGLFLLMKGRLSDLWWTTMLPYNFFLSAIAAALAVTSLVLVLSCWAFKQPPAELRLLQGLAKGTAYALILYALLRLGDLLVKGHLDLAFAGDEAARYFLLEIGAGVLLPILLLLVLNRGTAGILCAQLFTIAGIFMNRFNVMWFTQHEGSAAYFPSVTEALLSAGMFTAMLLLFRAAVLRLPIMKPAGS